MKRLSIEIKGVVQGVGFRPFVYNLAYSFNLKGYIKNTTCGVVIEVEGEAINLENFIKTLKTSAPPLSIIKNLIINEKALCNYEKFTIENSETIANKITLISPDVALCKDCALEIKNSCDKRYNYAFTNCTNCGPRFSIIKDLPYDRKNTTMKNFKLCNSCALEYTNPLNRRFHAEPNSCPNCGPKLWVNFGCNWSGNWVNWGRLSNSNCNWGRLSNNFNGVKIKKVKNGVNGVINGGRLSSNLNGVNIKGQLSSNLNEANIKGQLSSNLNEANIKRKLLSVTKPLDFIRAKIEKGKIIAVKGIGGFHLTCNALNIAAVNSLREKKKRPFQPFSLMMRDIETVKEFCYVNSLEEEVLLGKAKPILILRKKKNIEGVSPGLNTFGVMLPFSPIHMLLFSDNLKVLVMTSGNLHNRPLEFENRSALENLGDIVDYFLIHNREISIPIDDSIAKVIEGEVQILRRARGYVPLPLNFSSKYSILSLGSCFKNTFSICKEDNLFLSQHNGDLESICSIDRYKNNIKIFSKLFNFSPDYISFDMHPELNLSKYLDCVSTHPIKVQHHHAHAVSCMVENSLYDMVLAVVFDGTGFGLDNSIWGGEFLTCNRANFKREAHIDYVKLIGGDAAAKEPFRMELSYLYKAFVDKELSFTVLKNKASSYGLKGEVLLKMLENQLNLLNTSSVGRLFDAVASLLNLCSENTYEGQAASMLEALLPFKYDNLNNIHYSYEIVINEKIKLIKLSKMIKEILQDLDLNIPKDFISLKFHNTIVNFTVEICKTIRKEKKLNKVVLSGGVFQNSYLLINIKRTLLSEGFSVYYNQTLPINDGGISAGQLAVADAILRNKN